MPLEDTDRLYGMMRELREEVVGYRADLNGRLRTLEAAEAHRKGADAGRSGIGRLVVATAAVAGSVSAITITLTTQL